MTGIAALGVAHGRFQVLHLDHMEYILAAKDRCRHLIVAITNPDPSLTKYDPSDPERSNPAHNPLTYYERYVILKEALLAQGLDHRDFSLVPLPINFPELYQYYVPRQAVFYLTIYDAWGERKLKMFESLGLPVEVLWRKPKAEKGLTSTLIRQKIAQNQPWEHLVPAGVSPLLVQMGLVDRIRRLAAES
jgi:nicotinamide mononucleotide adenylyltransferase